MPNARCVFVGDGWPSEFPKQEEEATQLRFWHTRNTEKHPTTERGTLQQKGPIANI